MNIRLNIHKPSRYGASFDQTEITTKEDVFRLLDTISQYLETAGGAEVVRKSINKYLKENK